MQHDEVIWQVINQHHCSFKIKVPGMTRGKRDKSNKQTFCRNPKNVSGLCNRSSCPLANSRYATIVEDKGVCFLYMKTIERAHTPSKMWEKIKLPANYSAALALIDQQLQHSPKFQIHKCKQRFTKITQYLIRMRKLKLKVRPKLVGIHKKVERREARREAKAAIAARLEKSIEKELLERLKQGTYGGIYNFPIKEYESALDREGVEVDEISEEEEEREGQSQYVEDDEMQDFDDMEDFGESFSEDEGQDDDGDNGDGQEDSDSEGEQGAKKPAPKKKPPAPKKKPAAKRGAIEVEYEEERESASNIEY